MIILGIESSADETAAAVVEFDGQQNLKILSNVVASSLDQQIIYGGIVPEVAARSHLESITPVVERALGDAFDGSELGEMSNEKKAQSSQLKTHSSFWEQLDGIAVTYGPGLGGCLLIGVMTARTLAIAKNKPLYAINHVLAHPYASFITESSSDIRLQISDVRPEFPMLTLIVSGGHTQLVIFRDHFDYDLLGQTHDDAVGEAFDKVAKILGLPYPGGPSINTKAKEGNPLTYKLPKANMSGRYDFSFSGLKTALLRVAQAEIGEDYGYPSHMLSKRLSEAQKADFAASFQHIALETLVDKTLQAYEEFQPKSLVVAGGVAASAELRRQIADRLPIPAIFPDMKLCTDNAAMIAALGCFMAAKNQPPADPYSLDINPSLSM